MGHSTSTCTHTHIKPTPKFTGVGTCRYGYGYRWVMWVQKPTWVDTAGCIIDGRLIKCTTTIHHPNHYPAQPRSPLHQAVSLPPSHPCPSPNPSYSKHQDTLAHVWTELRVCSKHEIERVSPY